MNDLFFYPREIEFMRNVENPAEGAPKQEVVKKTIWECFNINKVIRGVYTQPDVFTVLLDDGHEETQLVKKPLLDNKDNPLKNKDGTIRTVEVKERSWYISQIELTGEALTRFMDSYNKPNANGVSHFPSQRAELMQAY